MRTTILFVALSLLAISCRGQDVQDQDAIAQEFFRIVASGQEARALELFHFPPAERGAELTDDKNGVADLLSIMAEKYGVPRQPTLGDTGVTLDVACGGGDLPYWRDHPSFVSRSYAVKFDRWGAGRVTFDLCKIGPRWQIRQVKYGLPASNRAAATLMQQTFAEMLRRHPLPN